MFQGDTKHIDKGLATTYALDITGVDGLHMDIMHPDEVVQGIVKIMKALPPGRYAFGFPRSPFTNKCTRQSGPRPGCDPATSTCRTDSYLKANTCDPQALKDYKTYKRFGLWDASASATCPCLKEVSTSVTLFQEDHEDAFLFTIFVDQTYGPDAVKLDNFIDKKYNEGRPMPPEGWLAAIKNAKYRETLSSAYEEVKSKGVTIDGFSDALDHFHIHILSDRKCSFYEITCPELEDMIKDSKTG